MAVLLTLGPFVCRGAALELSDELSLRPSADLTGRDGPSLLDGECLHIMEESLSMTVDDVQPVPTDKSVTNMAGIDLADFNNSVYALAIRDETGLGLGMASSGGLALTGGFTTKDGMQVSVYYVRRVSETLYEAFRDIGIDDLPARTVGVTVGWKF